MSAQPAASDLPLRDIHLPPEPSWWPPAPGWWLLALLLIAVAVFLWRTVRRRMAQRSIRRDILRQFEAELAQRSDASDRLRCTATFVRRWQLRHRSDLSNLRGEAWLEWLDADEPDKPFSRGVGRLLVDALYQPHCERDDVEPCIELVRRTLARGSSA